MKYSGRHGYAEYPDFEGVVFEILDTKREDNEVVLKIKEKVQEE